MTQRHRVGPASWISSAPCRCRRYWPSVPPWRWPDPTLSFFHQDSRQSAADTAADSGAGRPRMGADPAGWPGERFLGGLPGLAGHRGLASGVSDWREQQREARHWFRCLAHRQSSHSSTLDQPKWRNRLALKAETQCPATDLNQKPANGFEPMAFALQKRCSTTELSRQRRTGTRLDSGPELIVLPGPTAAAACGSSSRSWPEGATGAIPPCGD